MWSTLHGKTAVVVGTGIIGEAIGELLQAFGMHTIGVTRTPRKITGYHEVMPQTQLLRAAADAGVSGHHGQCFMGTSPWHSGLP